MSQAMRTRKGAILMWRLGNLEFGKQDRWARAPESRGLWAFPWPYWETFLTFHQYKDRLPKRYRSGPHNMPEDKRWYIYADGSPAGSAVTFDDDGWVEQDAIRIDEAFFEGQRQWIETVGKRILPIRKFWYDGDLYSHIDRKGVIGSTGTFMGGETDWHRMHSSELAPAILRARGDRYVERPSTRGLGLSIMRASRDHLEVFIPAHVGKLTAYREST